jgi:hypothetical protein
VRKTDGQDTTTGTTYVSASGLDLALAANTTYSFEYYILFSTAVNTTGIGLGVTGPAGATTVAYTVSIPRAADGTAGLYNGWGTAWDDTSPLGDGVQTANTTYVARIHGVVRTGGTAGNLTPRFRSEVNTSTVRVHDYSWGSLYTP